MDDDFIIRQFDDIDKKVELLIGRCKSLVSENLELKNKITSLEQEFENQSGIEKRNSEQSDKIRSRIDNLIEKLNKCSELQS